MMPTVLLGLLLLASAPDDLDQGLVAHWPLSGDFRDHSGNGLHAVPEGEVDPAAPGPGGEPGRAVGFDGRGSLRVPPLPALDPGVSDLTISAWVYTEEQVDSPLGDLLSQYDPQTRRGLILGIKTNAGVTFSQANDRHLQFGIDDDRQSEWTSAGIPGEGTLFACALAVHDGQLFAGTCEPAEGDSGHVYRFVGGTENQWVDCGAPDGSNAVTALAVYNGRLYAGTGRYRVAGSSLPESPNSTPGGRVFRYEGGTSWTDCGRLGASIAVSGLAVFQGSLYAGSLYEPAGFFRYEGGSTWTALEPPDGHRVQAIAPFDGLLHAGSYDLGHVYQYDGQRWSDLGAVGDPQINTQTYSFAVYQGRLHVATWRSGRVYRLGQSGRWEDLGRLGEELEVMGMLVHNGRLMAGTLPLAQIYRFEGEAGWRLLTQLDHTPDVVYRRAWTMAEHGGRLFVSTLPSAEVFSFRAGASVQWGRRFPSGWHHVAAIRSGDTLHLVVDGTPVASETVAGSGAFSLTTGGPLRIGSGPNAPFRGRLADLRLHHRALTRDEVLRLASP
ncbi:LamG domain-containing protein [Tautonia sociabilis]|uniref:LamG domain-containing protein n=1 Tax=Tautonia sociabilis TaxID=2080755 RepID=A0A432ML06_9BACT|nr:LamG domain-containing protein [Tautonia sociabilis]RUL88091.1 LamG domain-containing protein [Tautonia sociabilis]